MLNSTVLDVAIGLAFTYLLLGLMCTTVNEWIAGMLKRRAKNLEEGIRRLLTAPPAGTELLRPTDLKNPGSLLLKLKDPKDDLSTYIRSKFDPDSQAKIDSYAGTDKPADDVIQALCNELNKQIRSQDLFNKQRFPASSLSPSQIENAKHDPLKLQEINRNLLQDAYPEAIPSFADEFYGHPLIKALIPKTDDLPKKTRFGRKKPEAAVATPKKAHPSYVPSRTFALAIMDIVIRDQRGPTDFDRLMSGIEAMPESDVKKSLFALMQNTDRTLATAQTRIEGWFNDAMDRVSGWYKRKTQLITVGIAIVITIAGNADTLVIANKLFLSPTLRDTVVAAARERAAGPRPISEVEYTDPSNPKPSAPVPADSDTKGSNITPEQRRLLGELASWSEEFRKFNQLRVSSFGKGDPETCMAQHSTTPACVDAVNTAKQLGDNFPGLRLLWYQRAFWQWLWWLLPRHLVGWILTAIAVSLGAPFWFDTLNRFMNLRAAGKSPNEGPKGPEKKTA